MKIKKSKDELKKIATLVRMARAKLDMNQKKFAARMGVESEQTIINWEKGKVSPPKKSIREICNILEDNSCPPT